MAGFGAACVVAPSDVAACGGLFCSQSGTPTTPPQPIYQAGEKILFSVDPDGAVVAVIQVAYTGPSSSFAWIVPVSSVPEVSVGSPELFALVDVASSPYYGTEIGAVEGACADSSCPGGGYREYPGGYGGGCGFSPSTSGTTFYSDASATGRGGAASGGTTFGASDGVHVDSRGDVGPYEVVVLSGTDVESVQLWLSANGYVVPDETVSLLEPYVAAHDHFVALRLRKDATTGEIVPLVLRYVGEPCIPIRLTAVATVPDMPITAFFLSDVDMRSSNYLETELPFDARLYGPGVTIGTYTNIVSNAVDDAGGHAFVREFAGSTPTARLVVPDLADLRTASTAHGLAAEIAARLTLDDALAGAFARAFAPPEGVPPRTFLSCLAMTDCVVYDDYLRTVRFDPAAIVDAIDADVLAPRRAANYMLADHPRLSRLATTLSASEMTIDPTFVRIPRHDVSNRHVAEYHTECSSSYLMRDAPIVLRYPNGTSVPYSRGAASYCSRPSHSCFCDAPRGAGVSPWPVALGVTLALAVARARRRRLLLRLGKPGQQRAVWISKLGWRRARPR